jgi:MFS family permease
MHLDYDKLMPDQKYLVKLTITCLLSSMQLGAALSATASTLSSLEKQLKWTKDNVDTNKTLISTASVLGISIGAIVGGKIIAYGRRKSVLIFDLLGIIGSVLSIIENFYVILVGRLMYGFAAGVLVTACPKIVEETVPSAYMDLGYGISTNLGINLFVMISLLSGLIIPSDTADLLTSQNWKIVYLIPVPLMLIALLL